MMRITAYSILLLSLLVITKPLYALSCMPAPIESSFANLDYVFIGTVTKVGPETGFEMDKVTELTFDVHEVYKGNLSKTVVLYAASYWGNVFTQGNKYLMAAQQQPTRIFVDDCSASKNVIYAEEELKKLPGLKALTSENRNSNINGFKAK